MGRKETSSSLPLALLLALLLSFALQAFSPLRLNTDATTFLSMAESASEGHGFLQNGARTVFPPGYPALLVVLLKLGLAHSWVIIILNVIFSGLGTLGAYRVLVQDLAKQNTVALYLCLFSLLSFVVIKHLTIALSDLAFFCLAMSCLAVTSRASAVPWGRPFALAMGGGWILMAAAVSVRRIGIALIPPLIFVVVSRPAFKARLRSSSGRAKFVVGLVFAAGLAATAWIIAATSTLSDFKKGVGRASWSGAALKICYFRLAELGELITNISMAMLPRIAHGIVPLLGLAQGFIVFAGLILFLLTLWGLIAGIRNRKKICPADLFLAGYMAVLFAWPYRDTRFWLPVIPLLAGYSEEPIRQAIKVGFPRGLVAAYVSAFTILGVAAIAYSTRISFAGPRFADLYGDGTLRPTYCVALRACSGKFDEKAVDPESFRLLQTFR